MRDARPGERLRISATDWNRHNRVAEAYERGDLQHPAGIQSSSIDPTIIKIKNSSGADREQFEILKIGAPLILPSANEAEFRRHVVFDGVATTDGCQFAVLLKPAAEDAIVEAKIAGVIQSKITKTTTSPTLPCSLKVVAGEYKLKQSSGGSAAQAIWIEAGEGVKWAVIQLGQAAGKPPLVALLNETLLAQASASATLYEGDPGSLSLGGENVTIWDGIMDPGDLIEAGSRVWVAPSYNGELFAIVPYCKPTGTAPPPAVTDPPPPEEEDPPWPEYPIPAHDIEVMELIVPPSSVGDGLNNEGEET
jgi:hypothetical protein